MLLASGTGEARNLAFGIARAVKLTGNVSRLCVRRDRGRRSEAIAARTPGRDDAAGECSICPGQPSDLQVTAVQSVSSADDESVTSVLLKNWSCYTPKVRAAVITSVFSRTSRLSQLLDAVEQKQISANEIDAFRRVQLRENSDAAIQERTQRLLTECITGASDEIVANSHATLDKSRDAQPGESVFKSLSGNSVPENAEFAVGRQLSAGRFLR